MVSELPKVVTVNFLQVEKKNGKHRANTTQYEKIASTK